MIWISSESDAGGTAESFQQSGFLAMKHFLVDLRLLLQGTRPLLGYTRILVYFNLPRVRQL